MRVATTMAVASLVGGLACADPAHAQDGGSWAGCGGASQPGGNPTVELIGEYGDWSAYTGEEPEGLVCFIVSARQPVGSPEGGQCWAYARLAHRPYEGSFDVPSFVVGIDFAPNTLGMLDLAGTRFSLFALDDTGWMRGDQEPDAVAAMLEADALTVTGRNVLGEGFAHTHSLNGFDEARRAIDDACERGQIIAGLPFEPVSLEPTQRPLQ